MYVWIFKSMEKGLALLMLRGEATVSHPVKAWRGSMSSMEYPFSSNLVTVSGNPSLVAAACVESSLIPSSQIR